MRQRKEQEAAAAAAAPAPVPAAIGGENKMLDNEKGRLVYLSSRQSTAQAELRRGKGTDQESGGGSTSSSASGSGDDKRHARQYGKG